MFTLPISKSISEKVTAQHCIELAQSFKRFFPEGEYPRKKDLLAWLDGKDQRYADEVWKHAQGVNI